MLWARNIREGEVEKGDFSGDCQGGSGGRKQGESSVRERNVWRNDVRKRGREKEEGEVPWREKGAE